MSVKLERRPSAAAGALAGTRNEPAGAYCARVLDGACLLEAEAFERLRFGYFVRQRGWVAEDVRHPGREKDGYDAHSHHLGVFRGERLVAYLRALPWRPGGGFMLENEFRCLVPDGAPLPRAGAVELTRLVVAPPDELARVEVRAATELLFRLFYQVARREGWSRLYAVVEEAWLPVFSRRFGLSLEPLGCPHAFPDGTRTVAAQSLLCDLEAELARRCPEKLRWYQEP